MTEVKKKDFLLVNSFVLSFNLSLHNYLQSLNRCIWYNKVYLGYFESILAIYAIVFEPFMDPVFHLKYFYHLLTKLRSHDSGKKKLL